LIAEHGIGVRAGHRDALGLTLHSVNTRGLGNNRRVVDGFRHSRRNGDS
jgi:hypothetical protein